MEINGKNVMLAYADDIVILRYKENAVVKVTEQLIESSHKMDLIINEKKNQVLVMIRHVANKAALKVGPYSFEKVDD